MLRIRNVALGVAVAITGCGHGAETQEPEFVATEQVAALTQARSCPSLLAQFQRDAIAKVEMEAAQFRRWYLAGGRGAAAETDATFDGASTEDPPDEFSETNTQVAGVDEADFVKTNGTRIYLLQGTELAILNSWPAKATSLLATAEIEGQPVEFYVEDNRVVVFSSVRDPRQSDNSKRDETACAGFRGCYWHTPFTKITVLRVDNDDPKLERELYFEGHYRSSRRYGPLVRTVLQTWGRYYRVVIPEPYEFLRKEEGGWDPSEDGIEAWRQAAIAAIRQSKLEDWLPARWERRGGVEMTLPSYCSGFHTPAPGHVADGLVQIVGFDMTDTTSTVTQTAISGYVQNVYSNHDTLLLTQQDYGAWWRAYQRRAPVFRTWTFLHKFSLSETGDAHYEASGVLPGHTLNQFSLEARGDHVFAATTQWEQRGWWDNDTVWTPPVTTNHLVSLAERSRGRLAIVGRTDALAKGETIQSVRFLGDIAYVVTFRQVDPLFAIDIHNPEAPQVLGELKIEGFSTYMHPLGDDHLLTIGYDADDTGRRQGLAVQIFDVSDPVSPARTHKHVFQDRWGYSQANWNHKAFTFFGSRSLLAFPYQAWSERSFRSSLELLHIDPVEGIRPVGSIDHSESVGNICPSDHRSGSSCWNSLSRVRRGLFVEDYVYSISHGAVLVHDTRDLDAPVTELQLPQDGVRRYYWWWW